MKSLVSLREMQFWAWGMLAMLLGFLSGCAKQDRLVVYADPWLEDYATQLCAAYQAAHPGTEIALKVLSTEVIAQHIHFGQPIDVALCYGKEWITDPIFLQSIAQEASLASSQLVEAGINLAAFAAKIETMRTAQSLMIEASDRPTHRYAEAEAWWPQDTARTFIIANFQRQAEDYLLRGWVPSGIVPNHFLLEHSQALHVLRRGRLIPNAFTSNLMVNAPHPEQAAAFFAFTNAEKSKEILGELKILP